MAARLGLTLIGVTLAFVASTWAVAGAVAENFGSLQVERARDFPQLSHNVADYTLTYTSGAMAPVDFLTVFERTGGVARWGYPTSEPFEESPGVLAQYFQRGVLDYRSGSSEVKPRLVWDHLGGGLGGSIDLGVETSHANDLFGGFATGPWGHVVSNFAVDGTPTGILDAYSRFGGAQSLGYPKTSARLDTGAEGTLLIPGAATGVIRQYFQAAVFPYIPGSPGPAQLALLGDLLRNRRYPNGLWEGMESFQPAPIAQAGDVLTLRRVRPPSRTIEDIVEYMSPSLARIEAPDGSCGSGFFVGRTGELLTNWHVVADAFGATVTTVDGQSYEAEIVAGDFINDLALLQVPGYIGTPLEWGDSDALRLGNPLIVTGFPATINDVDVSCSTSPIVSIGILAGRITADGLPYLQSNASLNPGVSGSPVVDHSGGVIGIATSGLGGLELTNFLIPESRAQPIVTRWIATQRAGGDLPLPIHELGAIADGETVSGTLASGERDRWTIEAQADQFIRFESAGFDTLLALRDEFGSFLAFDDDSGVDEGSMIAGQATQSGTYIVEIRGFDTLAGDYSLTYRTYVPAVRDRGELPLNVEVTGSLDAGDRERWMFSGQEGDAVDIESSGFDTILTLLGPDGAVIAEDDDGGENFASRIQTTLPATGDYVVEIRGYGEGFEFARGEYGLSRR